MVVLCLHSLFFTPYKLMISLFFASCKSMIDPFFTPNQFMGYKGSLSLLECIFNNSSCYLSRGLLSFLGRTINTGLDMQRDQNNHAKQIKNKKTSSPLTVGSRITNCLCCCCILDNASFAAMRFEVFLVTLGHTLDS